MFDFQNPGEGTTIRTTPSKKSKDGMKGWLLLLNHFTASLFTDWISSGIVSSISFQPDYSGIYAASSLTSAIALFSESTGEDPVAYLDGMTAPITQVWVSFEQSMDISY